MLQNVACIILDYLLDRKNYIVKVNYKRYIASPHFKRKAKRWRRRVGLRCQLCGRRGELHCHHRYYGNLGHEKRYDITILCKTCHFAFHKWRKYND